MTNGDVVIEDDGISEYFSLQPNGSFAPEAGDEGMTLTASDGAYQLVEPDGTTYQFNANGTLDYVAGHARQPHHRRLQHPGPARFPDRLQRRIPRPGL